MVELRSDELATFGQRRVDDRVRHAAPIHGVRLAHDEHVGRDAEGPHITLDHVGRHPLGRMRELAHAA